MFDIRIAGISLYVPTPIRQRIGLNVGKCKDFMEMTEMENGNRKYCQVTKDVCIFNKIQQ